MFSLQVIFLLNYFANTVSYGRYVDGCVESCNHHENTVAFEACLKICTNRGTQNDDQSNEEEILHADANYYPSAPFNVTVASKVIILDVKFLTLTVSWDFESDANRSGFYLRVTADEEWCEKDFPGYYAFNIDRLAKSHVVPLSSTDDQPLEIQHQCRYTIQMHSKPYPYGDEQYAVNLKYTVPKCVNGYCDCRTQQTVPIPRNLVTKTYASGKEMKVMVNWTYPSISTQTHDFRFDLSEKFHHNNVHFRRSDAFKYRLTDMPAHVVRGHENESTFSTVLPVNLASNEEYKLTLFALNDQRCPSDEIEVVFIAANNRTEYFISYEEPSLTTAPSATSYDSYDETTPTTFHRHYKGSSDKISNVTSFSDENFEKISLFFMQLNMPLIVASIAAGFLTITALASCMVIIIWKKCYQNKKSQIEKSSIIPWAMVNSSHSILETNILYRYANSTVSSKQNVEIPFNKIQVGAIIGQGAFGLVCMGTARGVEGYAGPTTVAIKQLKSNADEAERKEFIAEMETMKQVGRHVNIVAMFGCCTEPNHECMVMEYVPFGDLKHYLQNLRKQLELMALSMKSSMFGRDIPSLPSSLHSSFISNSEDSVLPSSIPYHFDSNELQSFGAQVANGMAHIESLGIIHRDLAARNILVGRSKQLKISDFGLSRHGVYVKTTKGVIPLRWLSIEAIQRNVYSTKSDAWAFGVVLWEICTLGGFPYPTISDKDILNYLLQGNRLEKPTTCSDEIYELMARCWATNPADRPSFAYLCDYLSELNNQRSLYVEFTANEQLPPPESYCVLSERPATHTRPSMLNLAKIDNDQTTSDV